MLDHIRENPRAATLKADEPGIDQLRHEVIAELELDEVAVEELLASLSKCLN